jgi:ADP-ribose pyrophosphatase YjhB (NUDIX family)
MLKIKMCLKTHEISMATSRRFASFNRGQSTTLGKFVDVPFRMKEIPDGGFCLSSFLVISESHNPQSVLMGHLNPNAAWDHIGALDQSRIEAHSKGWMLPSCHLMVQESPQDAARRILKEQVGIEGLDLSEPKVISEVYTPRRFPNLAQHWDLEFIFRGKLDQSELPKSDAWVDLKFVGVSKMRKIEMARSHEDILESSEFKFVDE